MNDDGLLSRLRAIDPATPERIADASTDALDLRRTIEAETIDELSARRRERRRRVGVVAAAAVVAAALLVPLLLLLPLGDDPTVIGTQPTGRATPTPSGSTPPSETAPGPLEPIEVAQPVNGATVTSPVTVSGTADVYEATVSIRVIDSVNNVIAETFTTATCGTGCRGDYRVDVPYSVNTEQLGVIQVFEVSAEDGRPINVVRVPVTLTPGPIDPVAAAVEGDWTAPDGSIAPAGDPFVIQSYEGPEHCGWTSATFLSLSWPVGTPADGMADARQYVRDPHGILDAETAGSFRDDTALPVDAEFTGYHRGTWQLWVAPSDADRAVYAVNADPTAQGIVERWTRARELIGCM
jgi:hypothetical protein